MSSIDRFGILRGTVDVPTQQADGSVRLENQPQWRQNLVLHWDMNPCDGHKSFCGIVGLVGGSSRYNS